MTSASAPTLERRRRYGPVLLALIAVSIVVLLIVVAMAIAWVVAKRKVAAEWALIEAAGEPLTPEDLPKFFEALATRPDDKPRTERWLAALAEIDSSQHWSELESWPTGSEPPPPGTNWGRPDDARSLLEKHRHALEDIHQAAAEGVACFPHWMDVDDVLGEASTLDCAAWLLTLEANVMAHEGNPHAAIDALRDLLAVGRSLAPQPLIVSQLIRIAIARRARAELQRLLPLMECSDDDLALVMEDLVRDEITHDFFRRALLGERASYMQPGDDPSTDTEMPMDDPDDPFAETDDRAFLYPLVRPADEYTCVRVWRATIVAASDMNLSLSEVSRRAETDLGRSAEELPAWRFPLTSGAVSTVVAFGRAADHHNALTRAVRTGLAIERFRRRTGRPPKDLRELVPAYLSAVPIDPMTQQPLRYLVDDTGYEIRCAGLEQPDEIAWEVVHPR